MAWNRWLFGFAGVLCAVLCTPQHAKAQFTPQTDPRPILANLIMAFQNCGPPQAYQILGFQLFQTISMQTGNSGCYLAIQQAGPITSMNVTGVQTLPAGPVFSVRVTHQNATPVDWFIGLSNLTGRVEYLNFQTVQIGAPPVTPQSVSPQQAQGGQIDNPPPPPTDSSKSKACETFPWMCPS